ncbi:MAG: zinc-binding dehydrogenase [Chloroflexi bacterium]|nr:zinc-binding dehydrogenase [Chloroflexota bacterium]
MGRALVVAGPRQLAYEDYPDPVLKPDEVRIQTLLSGISAGTEMTQYRGTNPYMNKRWDDATRLYVASDTPSWTYPVPNIGYEEVGKVVEVGSAVNDLAPGTRVFGPWWHRTHYVAPIDWVRQRIIPPGADPRIGIFSHIGAVGLNGVHDGRVRIGETVAVFGLGTPGQIVAQAARASGARVIAVDLLDARLEMAKQLGAHITLNPRRVPVAEEIKRLTDNRGADVVFEVAGSSVALNEAIRAAAYSGRVVAMGALQNEARGLYLSEEFHHNRVNIVCSQISGVDPELKYRWDKLRLQQSAVRLQIDGTLNLIPLITHRAPFDRAIELFELIDRAPESVVQAVIEFGD